MARRYSKDFKDRAVRMVRDRLEAEPGCSQWRAITDIAPKLGIAVETLRRWYGRWLMDTGELASTSESDNAEIKRLKRENAELRRANEILKTASAFFAAELD